jgi:2-succinyl-6-hydroxy-2,4-cyclohexadiene-1-carboxylate synthase
MNMMINGVNYSYHIEGSGFPVILLHGFTGSKENWSNLRASLSTQYKVITLDLIGHGNTDSPVDRERYEIERVCRDLASLMEKLHIEKVHLLGYSMGGRIALAFSILYPEFIRSLLLESSSPGLESVEERNDRKRADEQLAVGIERNGIEEFIGKWENIPLFKSQKLLPSTKQDKIRAQRLRNSPTGLANSLKGMGTGTQPSYWDKLHSLSFPVLFICGEWDEKFCLIAENMKKRMPNLSIFKVSNAGHAIHVEQPEFFGKIVMEFFQST